jgi:MFS family permease
MSSARPDAVSRVSASPDRPFNPWLVLSLAGVAQFMVVLDASIMNVALPSIQHGLHFSLADLQWVINMYVLTFGGFLLLGGRAGDLFGRRRLFMVRLGIFRNRSLTAINVTGLITGAAMFAMFYFLSLYLQEVLGYSPLHTGFAYLPMAFAIIVGAATAAPLVTRFGLKPVLIGGLVLAAIGQLLLTRLPLHGVYPTDVLPAMVVVALGLGLTFVPLTIGAVQGVQRSEVGLASGLINTSLQVGGALGLAVLSTIATSRFNDVIKTLHGPKALPRALLDGFQYAFVASVAILVLGVILALVLLPNRPATDVPAEAAASAAWSGSSSE